MLACVRFLSSILGTGKQRRVKMLTFSAPSVLPQLKKKVKMQNHEIPKSNTIGDKLPLRMPQCKWVGTWTTRPWEVSSHEEGYREGRQ